MTAKVVVTIVAGVALSVGVPIAPVAAQSSQQSGGQPQRQQHMQQQRQPQQHQQPQNQQQQAQMHDKNLESRIYVRLVEHPSIGPDIQVTVSQGTATLSGTVASEQAKRRALRVARRTTGVTEVKDQLRVDSSLAQQRPTAATVSERELSKQVAEKIAAAIPGAKTGEDWWFDGWRVEGQDGLWSFTVEAEYGTVWLDGDVPRYEIIRSAVEAARKVPAVQSVRNSIEVERYQYRYGYPYSAYGYGYPYYAYGYGYPFGYGWGYPHYGYGYPSALPRY